MKYVYNNEVKERLIGLENISRDKTAANITNKILNCLQEFGVEKNLISQSFDGAPVMSGRISGVQRLLKDKFPTAHFINYYAHQLNIVLRKTISKNSTNKKIFDFVNNVCKFFGHSSLIRCFFSEYVTDSIPSFCETRWSYNQRMVSFIYDNFSSLKEGFQNISKEGQEKLILKF